jgi:hypothetical protein
VDASLSVNPRTERTYCRRRGRSYTRAMKTIAAWAVWAGRLVAYAALATGTGAVFLPGAVRAVLMASGAILFFALFIETAQRPPTGPVHQVFAADGATVTDAIQFIQLGGSIHGASNLVGRLAPFPDTTDSPMLTTRGFPRLS